VNDVKRHSEFVKVEIIRLVALALLGFAGTLRK